jgi:hypothetical protein
MEKVASCVLAVIGRRLSPHQDGDAPEPTLWAVVWGCAKFFHITELRRVRVISAVKRARND